MYQKPREAKRLHFDVIPRAVDEYLQFLGAYEKQDVKSRLINPVWHIHGGNPPTAEVVQQADNNSTPATVNFAMLLNLVAVANSEDPAVVWGFLRRYAPTVSPQSYPRLDALIRYATVYFRDFVRPAKIFRAPDDVERAALMSLDATLAALPSGASAEEIQSEVYNVARKIERYQDFKAKGATPERPGVSNDWFNMLYQVLLGENRGPRFGSFAALYGIAETRSLIARALSGELRTAHEEFLSARRT